jgi:thioredoxin reductase (NADPH)
VYGAPWCPDCKRSKKFLAEHRIPYEWIDIDDDTEGLRFVEALQNGGRTIPTIVFPDGGHLLEPSDEDLARKLGLKIQADRQAYDLAIVGGGPAALAAAIYAAREGIDVVVIDRSAMGGQAGVTERIDNYPGFPEVCAHAALLATGSSYRRLGVPGEEDLIGAGVHFCATCDGPFYRGAEELLVIGGGNSGLEEGLFLSQFAKRIRIVEFNPELKASKLLQDKVRSHPQFVVHTNMQVVELKGKPKLKEVVARDRATGEEHRWHPAAAFVFIGLDPNTSFLKGALELDRWGFVETHGHQTSMPGVFCAGDVRAGSTKQLGAAVGEGISALLEILQYLQEHHHVFPHAVNA